jgi:CheY-like chemotaxis protein
MPIQGQTSLRNVLLYADDDNTQLFLKRALFELWGYSVFTAASGEEACELFGQHEFHVAVLDYRMGGMNGGETACALRKFYPMMPTILYTGEVDIPQHSLRCVSRVVRKADNPDSLRQALLDLTPPIGKPQGGATRQR